jgi:hypothetical protein
MRTTVMRREEVKGARIAYRLADHEVHSLSL